jgi:hypothetical protein
VRRVEELTPVSVTRLVSGRWIVDVGQNIHGWIRLSRLGAAGTEVRCTYGEWLDDAGDVTQEHLVPHGNAVDLALLPCWRRPLAILICSTASLTPGDGKRA